MNARVGRSSAIALTLTTAMCSLSGCGHSTHVRYQDDLVKVTERSTINFINVHASSDTEVLTIWGREFKDVRGRSPCYLRIPGRPMILFVTGRDFDNGQATVHLADTSSRRVVDFSAHDSRIGSNIGPPGTNWYERVASVQGQQLAVEAAESNCHYKYSIDLATPSFEKEEQTVEDPATGNIIHHVYEHGIAHR